MSYELDRLTEKFQNCAEFNHLVKMLELTMIDGKITPQDVRDAAFVAGVHIAMRETVLFGVSPEEINVIGRSRRGRKCQ